jgi:hypothetical protein
VFRNQVLIKWDAKSVKSLIACKITKLIFDYQVFSKKIWSCKENALYRAFLTKKASEDH